MEKFSYYYELYHNEVFDIDEMIEHKEQIENAEKVEKYLCSLNDNTDIIRNAIVCSFKFKKILEYEERLHYVRGIIYSWQYMNQEDLLKLINDIQNSNNDYVERSLFDVRYFSDEYDEEFFNNYLDNIKVIKKEENITEDYLKEKIDEIGEPINKTELVKEDTEDMTVDEFFEDSYEMTELEPLERVDLFKKYYNSYKEGVLRYKNINKNNNPIEYEYVSAGMDDYNKYIMGCFEIMHELLINDFKRKSRNLLLSI